MFYLYQHALSCLLNRFPKRIYYTQLKICYRQNTCTMAYIDQRCNVKSTLDTDLNLGSNGFDTHIEKAK